MDITSLIRWMAWILLEKKQRNGAVWCLKEVSLKKGYHPPPRPKNKQTNKQQEWRVTGKTCEKKVNAKVEFKGESAKEH